MDGYKQVSLFGVGEDKVDYSNFFTKSLYNNAYESISSENRMPICIPSYNNFDSATVKLLQSSNLDWPIYIVVRNTQANIYKELYPKATIISVQDELINSGTKAKKYIFEHFSGNIFQFDDDLVSITYCFPGYTKDNKIKTCREKEVDAIRVIAMWQLIHEKIVEKYPHCWASEPSRDLYSWSYDITNYDIKLAINSPPSSIFAVNLDTLRNNDVFIDKEISADDVCTYWLALDKGLWPSQIKLISCELGKPRLEHYGKGCNSLKERFEMQTTELLAKYNFPWSKIKMHKTFGNFHATDTKIARTNLIIKGTFPSKTDISYNSLK